MEGRKRKKLKSDDVIKDEDSDVKTSNYSPPGYLPHTVGTSSQVHTIPLRTT